MRLIRSVFRPANDGLSLRFQRCQHIETSVLNETSNSVRVSNMGCSNRSYAASASASAASSALEDRKPQRRISKSERITMVENYVNKYRAKSEGKFPSASETMKEVGGNYYVIRQILQEMMYHAKQPSLDSKDTSLGKSTRKKNEMICNSKESKDSMDVTLEESPIKNREMACNSEEQSVHNGNPSLQKSAMKEDEISTKFEEVTQTRELGERIRPILKDSESSDSVIFQSQQGQQSLVSDDTDEPKVVGAQSHHPVDGHESSWDLDYKKEVKQEILGDLAKSNKHKAGPQESTDMYEGGSQEVPSEAQTKSSSLWDNLKSFANGIFSKWKRS